MLTTGDYQNNLYTLKTIEHLKDDMDKKLPLSKILLIIEFIVMMANKIFFTKDGKPKNKLQLVLSIPAIISFVKELLGMINKNVDKKSNSKIGASTKIDKAIKEATRRVEAYKTKNPK